MGVENLLPTSAETGLGKEAVLGKIAEVIAASEASLAEDESEEDGEEAELVRE